jgi:ribosomal-protein-alanine N-acetyltransferase
MNEKWIEDKTQSAVLVDEIRRFEDLPSWVGRDELALFLHDSLKPWEDPLPDIQAGLTEALQPVSREPGFVLLAEHGGSIAGVLVMLRTGMKGYGPENLLLWVAVAPGMRGKGLGRRLIERSFEMAEGSVKLHVEYDNPARRLYERLGMTSKYAEMRYTR